MNKQNKIRTSVTLEVATIEFLKSRFPNLNFSCSIDAAVIELERLERLFTGNFNREKSK